MRRLAHAGARRAGVPAGAVGVGAMVALTFLAVGMAGPAHAAETSTAQAAARVALDRGYRTGVAVLDLTTGVYAGGGDDTDTFPTQSVVKVLIATRLLLTGQMTGATAVAANRMITASDDQAADALYLRAGGDEVLPLVSAHYGIPDLGAPPTTPGRWGLTRVTARGLVQLYAALARDQSVSPWLSDAMAHAAPVAADGTRQLFGLAAATPGAAIKQGWGHDASGNAVVNSTGYAQDGRFAVAILTVGPPYSYAATLEAAVSAQARALLPGGRLSDLPAPSTAAGAPGGRVASVTGGPGYVSVTGTEFDPALPPGGAPSLTVSIDGRPSSVLSAGPQRRRGGPGAGPLPYADYAVRVPARAGAHTVRVTCTGAGGRQTVQGSWSVTVQPTAAQAHDAVLARVRVAGLAATGTLAAAGLAAAALVTIRRALQRLRRGRLERRARAARERLARALRAAGPAGRVVRLPSGQLVRVRTAPHPEHARPAPAGPVGGPRPRAGTSRAGGRRDEHRPGWLHGTAPGTAGRPGVAASAAIA